MYFNSMYVFQQNSIALGVATPGSGDPKPTKSTDKWIPGQVNLRTSEPRASEPSDKWTPKPRTSEPQDKWTPGQVTMNQIKTLKTRVLYKNNKIRNSVLHLWYTECPLHLLTRWLVHSLIFYFILEKYMRSFVVRSYSFSNCVQWCVTLVSGRNCCHRSASVVLRRIVIIIFVYWTKTRDDNTRRCMRATEAERRHKVSIIG